MPLRNLLSAERIAVPVELHNRAAVLDVAARLLAGPVAECSPHDLSGCTALARTIVEALHKREELASTGIGHGVAVPHARIDGIGESRAAFLRLARPVDFNAADGEPVDLVLALVVPVHDVQQHLEFLAEVAEMFADPCYRAELRAATTITSLRRRLLRGDSHAACA